MNRQMQHETTQQEPMGTCRRAGSEDKNSLAVSVRQKNDEGLKGR
jgi:hypothetical protein